VSGLGCGCVLASNPQASPCVTTGIVFLPSARPSQQSISNCLQPCFARYERWDPSGCAHYDACGMFRALAAGATVGPLSCTRGVRMSDCRTHHLQQLPPICLVRADAGELVAHDV
jgi:hypothetical protein